MNNKLKYILPLIMATTGTSAYEWTRLTWDWSTINTDNPQFPAGFLYGTTLEEHQNSGTGDENARAAGYCPKNNWVTWEERLIRPDGQPTIKDFQQSERACDHWVRYKEDIQLIKDLGANSFYFSIDWSVIEPKEGKYDRQALQHYHDMIDTLLQNGITPVVALHHFVHPQWFEDKGAFEKTENIALWIRFCKLIFSEFNSQVKLWITIIEPGPYVVQGYVRAVWPPAKKNLQLAGTVLRNLLIAHVCAYHTLKRMPGGDQAQIGFNHNYLRFEAYSSWNPIERTVAYYLNHIFNDAILEFIKTGEFSFHIASPVVASVDYTNELAPKSFDFIGLNYYSRVLVHIGLGKADADCLPGEIMTDYGYPIYAEGLYQAIKIMSEYKVPIYVTENGISDARDDRRELFIRRYLYAITQAIKEGCDVRGYFYWTLMDDFEWDEGYAQKFGLYAINFATRECTLRKGAKFLQNLYKQNTQHIGQSAQA
ncbi:MAG: family 1 glycosylhydrolase [Candidatus Babeliales bacterium]|jgi:beta-glucosidase